MQGLIEGSLTMAEVNRQLGERVGSGGGDLARWKIAGGYLDSHTHSGQPEPGRFAPADGTQ